MQQSKSEVKTSQHKRNSIIISQFDDDSNQDSDTNQNLIVADELIKNKETLAKTLSNAEAITMAELQDIENLNPYKDWIIKVLK